MTDAPIEKDNENALREDAKAVGGFITIEFEKLEAIIAKHFKGHPAVMAATADVVAASTVTDAPKA